MMGGNFNRYSNERKGEHVDVGFCGPGLMGAPMIRHLLTAGHRVHVWNRTRAKADALAGCGAQVVDTPAELAARAQTVMLCVLDAQAVGDVVFGASGVLAGTPRRAACGASSIIRALRPRRRAPMRRARRRSA